MKHQPDPYDRYDGDEDEGEDPRDLDPEVDTLDGWER